MALVLFSAAGVLGVVLLVVPFSVAAVRLVLPRRSRTPIAHPAEVL